jgi:hypothetical protein
VSGSQRSWFAVLTVVLDPSITRVSVTGNIADLRNPKQALARSFLSYSVSSLVVLWHIS